MTSPSSSFENSTPLVHYQLDLVLSAAPPTPVPAPALPAGLGLLFAAGLGGLGMLWLRRRAALAI